MVGPAVGAPVRVVADEGTALPLWSLAAQAQQQAGKGCAHSDTILGPLLGSERGTTHCGDVRNAERSGRSPRAGDGRTSSILLPRATDCAVNHSQCAACLPLYWDFESAKTTVRGYVPSVESLDAFCVHAINLTLRQCSAAPAPAARRPAPPPRASRATVSI